MRITKIKLSPTRVRIEYEKPRPGGEGADEFTLNCCDKPRPELGNTLLMLRSFVLQICELPDNLLDRLTVTGASYSYGGEKEVMGAVITAQLSCPKSGAVLNLNTPHLPSEPYGDDPLLEGRLLPEKCVDALGVLERECLAYIQGERAQGELPLDGPKHEKAREYGIDYRVPKEGPLTMELDMGKRCSACGTKGVGKSGLCVKCATDRVLAQQK